MTALTWEFACLAVSCVALVSLIAALLWSVDDEDGGHVMPREELK